MVRMHFDPYISQFDLSKQPILVIKLHQQSEVILS